MSNIIGYDVEQKKLSRNLKRGNSVILIGESGIGKSFFVEKWCEENGFEMTQVSIGKPKSIENQLRGFYKKKSFSKHVIIFDDLEAFLALDKGTRTKKGDIDLPLSEITTTELYFQRLLTESNHPILLISQSKGDGRSKDRTKKAISKISKAYTPIELKKRTLLDVRKVLDEEKLTYESSEITDIYKKSSGNITKIMTLVLGGIILKDSKTLSTKDFMNLAATNKPQAYDFAIKQPDKDFPLNFFLTWTIWNAHNLYPNNIRAISKLQTIAAEFDVLKYKGIKNEIYASLINLFPNKKASWLDFPKSWGVGKEPKVIETKKEEPRKKVVKLLGKKKKRSTKRSKLTRNSSVKPEIAAKKTPRKSRKRKALF